MSGLSLKIDLMDGASPRLKKFYASLSDLRGLHEGIGMRARNLTRDHLIGLAKTRHATSNRLGAKPSGHWAQAAEKTTFSADSNAATITVAHAGIGRAFHDVEILPGKGKKALTIPLIAQAYNLRAAGVWKKEGLFIAKGKRKGKQVSVVAKRLPGGTVQAWYLLVPRVLQKQDRTLLPSDEQYQLAAKRGVRDYVSYLLSK